MTNEEVIKILNTVLFFGKCDCQKEEIEECLRIVIKALKQESCEDAISRQAVLEAIIANCIWENEYNLTSCRIKKAVENLPPVIPQTKINMLDKIKAEIKE